MDERAKSTRNNLFKNAKLNGLKKINNKNKNKKESRAAHAWPLKLLKRHTSTLISFTRLGTYGIFYFL